MRVLGNLDTTQLVSLKHLRAPQRLVSTPYATAINILPSARLFELYANQFDALAVCPLERVIFEVIDLSPTIDSWQRLDQVLCQPPYFDLTRQRKGQLPLKVGVRLSIVHDSCLDETGGCKVWEQDAVGEIRAVLAQMVECHSPNISFTTKYSQNPASAEWKY